MTPPGHALTGMLAAAAVVYALPGAPERRYPLILWAVVGALAPDLDAISLLFSHDTYFGMAWYSHRGFLHSIAGCALIAMLFPALLGALGLPARRGGPREGAAIRSAALAVFAGGLLHLASDLPTPPGPWAGLPLFFPLPFRIGGWSHIGWVNAALLILLAAAALAATLLALAHRLSPTIARPWLRAAIVGIALFALAGTLWFGVVSRYEGLAQWRAWQSRFVPVAWIDTVHDLARPAGVFWEREVLPLPSGDGPAGPPGI